MELSKQVCSLEQAKRLNALGVTPSSSLYSIYWFNTDECPNDYELSYGSFFLAKDEYAAFTVAELGVMLPNYTFTYKGAECMIVYNTIGIFSYVNIHVIGKTSSLFMTQGDTEAEARAAMLIYLLENMIPPDEVNKRILE